MSDKTMDLLLAMMLPPEHPVDKVKRLYPGAIGGSFEYDPRSGQLIKMTPNYPDRSQRYAKLRRQMPATTNRERQARFEKLKQQMGGRGTRPRVERAALPLYRR